MLALKPAKNFSEALALSLLSQALTALLSALALDEGALALCWATSFAAYWGTFTLMVCRRGKSPTRLDLFLVRWGFLMLFPFGAGLIIAAIAALQRALDS